MGVNSAGILSKLPTFKKVLSEVKPSIFFVQETKLKMEGKLKFENYLVFELIRKNKEGGGIAIGCEKSLKPAWVREGDDDAEALSIDIFVKGMKIRCCAAYGCQEGDQVERKKKFWNYLNEEVELAQNSNAGLIIQFDGNLWAGQSIIPGDPRPQNRNGKLFEEFLHKNPHLSVVNSLPLCEGLITRRRLKNGVPEESVLDFFIVCPRILPHITKMVVDEENKFVLTNYKTARQKGRAVDSDHKTLYLDLDLQIKNEKPIRREIFNFKDQKSQAAFKIQTSNTDDFTECFKNDLPILEQIESWRKVLKSYCSRTFKKIRVTGRKKTKPMNKEMIELINQRNMLLKRRKVNCKKCGKEEKNKTFKINCTDNHEVNENEIELIEKTISNIEAKENRELVFKHFKNFNENPEAINMGQVWKLMKKIWPKHGNILPVAKQNHTGKIVSSPHEIKRLLSKEYKDRLRNWSLRPDLEHI